MDAYLVSIEDSKPAEISIEHFQFKQFRRHNRANIKRQEDRKYYIGKKKVAVNRGKRAGQVFDSLIDLVEKEGDQILNQLTAKPAIRPNGFHCPWPFSGPMCNNGLPLLSWIIPLIHHLLPVSVRN